MKSLITTLTILLMALTLADVSVAQRQEAEDRNAEMREKMRQRRPGASRQGRQTGSQKPKSEREQLRERENLERLTGRKQPKEKVDSPMPVMVEEGVAKLSPENTKFDFVGTHVGEPNPRLGGFKKFDGKITMAEDGNSIESMSLNFDMKSIWTTIPTLTAHLKKSDFFNVEEFPEAKFTSTSVKEMEDGATQITGELTMHGVTSEISFPTKVESSDGGIMLSGEFQLDRTAFGMKEKLDRVQKMVMVKVNVGMATAGSDAPATPAGGSGQSSRANQFFGLMDADGDGKLTGDEIPKRIRDRMDMVDTDRDGSISLQEMQAGMGQQRPNAGDRPGAGRQGTRQGTRQGGSRQSGMRQGGARPGSSRPGAARQGGSRKPADPGFRGGAPDRGGSSKPAKKKEEKDKDDKSDDRNGDRR